MDFADQGVFLLVLIVALITLRISLSWIVGKVSRILGLQDHARLGHITRATPAIDPDAPPSPREFAAFQRINRRYWYPGYAIVACSLALAVAGLAGASDEVVKTLGEGVGITLIALSSVPLLLSQCPRCGHLCFVRARRGFDLEAPRDAWRRLRRFGVGALGFSRCEHCGTRIDWTEDEIRIPDG
jgi:hypothetical protein